MLFTPLSSLHYAFYLSFCLLWLSTRRASSANDIFIVMDFFLFILFILSHRREKEDRMEARVPKVILAGRCSKSSVVLLACTILTDTSIMRLVAKCQGLYWRLKELALPIWPSFWHYFWEIRIVFGIKRHWKWILYFELNVLAVK